MSPLLLIIPSSSQTIQTARFKNHKRKQPKPKKALKSSSASSISSCDSPNTTIPSGSNENPQNIRIEKEHNTNADLEDIIFFIMSPPCETNDTLDVGQEYKKYIFVPKTGVVKPKGIFYASIAATITDKNAIIKVPISQTFQ